MNKRGKCPVSIQYNRKFLATKAIRASERERKRERERERERESERER